MNKFSGASRLDFTCFSVRRNKKQHISCSMNVSTCRVTCGSVTPHARVQNACYHAVLTPYNPLLRLYNLIPGVTFSSDMQAKCPFVLSYFACRGIHANIRGHLTFRAKCSCRAAQLGLLTLLALWKCSHFPGKAPHCYPSVQFRVRKNRVNPIR